MKKIIQLALIAAAGLLLAATASPTVNGQDTAWEVPEEARAMENPLESSADVIAAGAELYERRCLMCHGETAKGDGPATRTIKPAPSDMSTVEARDRMTDGEIFYKISEGKRPMPPQKGKISEEEIWSLVHYVRSLQPAP